MPKVTFIAHDGSRHELQADIGHSLMQTALDHNLRGIDGDCGGQCACGTCHVFVAAPWAEQLPTASAMETEMLSFAAELQPGSRLACQIPMSDALDGIEVHMPQAQH
jgi:2Fe-2S ferredoxin